MYDDDFIYEAEHDEENCKKPYNGKKEPMVMRQKKMINERR